MAVRTLLLSATILFGVAGLCRPALAQRDSKSTSGRSPEAKREAELVFTEGMKYFILENYSRALGAFQRSAELNPDVPMVYYKIAEVYSKSSNPDDLSRAAANVEKALRLDKKNKYFYLLAAKIYRAQNNLSKAVETLETLTRDVDPGVYNTRGDTTLFYLATLYIMDRKLDDAIRTYNRVEDQLGINEVSSLQKQKIYFYQGKVEQALAEGERLVAAYPDEEQYVVDLAEALVKKDQARKAIGYLEPFLSTHPDAGSAKLLLASLYRDAGREKESRDLFTQAMADPAVDISSKITVIQTFTVQMMGTEKDPDLSTFAVGLYESLKVQHPDEPNVYVAGGNLFIALAQKEKASQAFLSAVQHGSASFEAWQNLLALEAEAGKFDSLVFHAEQGIEIFPNQALLYYFNGYGHLNMRRFREAIASLEHAKKLSAANPGLVHDINSMLGDAYDGAKEYIKSDRAYEAALAYRPDDPFVMNNYAFHLALRREQLDKAERMASQVVKEQPGNSTYLDTYAWVLYAREKYRDARKVMEQALALPEITAVHYEHYGDILYRLGEVDIAVRQWEKARTLTHEHEALDRKISTRRLN